MSVREIRGSWSNRTKRGIKKRRRNVLRVLGSYMWIVAADVLDIKQYISRFTNP